MKITDGEIIPCVGIGEFKLGMSLSEITNILGSDCKERELGIGSQIITENARFWFRENSLVQIGVTKGFEGKYNNIGIGSTLTDVKKYFGDYECNCDTYNPIGKKGMCFELEDIDDWEELSVPIEWIFIFWN